jgi:hypothetical protein
LNIQEAELDSSILGATYCNGFIGHEQDSE